MILLLRRRRRRRARTGRAVVTPGRRLVLRRAVDAARRVAVALRRRGITRFAVVEPDAAWVIRLLAGAALAGAEPCQYQPDTDAHELAEQARALGHSVVVTRRTDLEGTLRVVRPEELPPVPPPSPPTRRRRRTARNPS